MAQETIEQERTVEKTVTETETIYICDDCGMECDEDELIHVAVAPQTETPPIDWEEDMPGVEENVKTWLKLRGCVSQNTENQLLQNVVYDMTEMTVAKSLEVCPECLEDSYGVSLEEHDGQLFDERYVTRGTIEEGGGGDRTNVDIIITCAFYVSLFILPASATLSYAPLGIGISILLGIIASIIHLT